MFTEQPKALGQEIGALIVTSTASAQVAGATRGDHRQDPGQAVMATNKSTVVIHFGISRPPNTAAWAGDVMEERMAASISLNAAMQAVDVFLKIDGQPVRALIPREVFERCFNSAPTLEAWLQSYEENASILNAAICRRFAAKPQDFVVVRCGDFAIPHSRRC